MIKIHEGIFQILEWKGAEYYRFDPSGSWMERMGESLEPIYDETELENAYQALVNDHSSVRVGSAIYETQV